MKKSFLTAFAGAFVMGIALLASDVSAATTSCAAGKYLSGTTCKTCPGGQISAKGDNVCKTCGAGTYEYSHTQCKACPAGSYCVNGIKKDCANGYISGANASSCTICPEGQYEKNNKSCEACPAGSYCTKGIKKSCSNKQYCPANSTAPIACPANATCDGKKFTCKTGYDKEGNQCVGHCEKGEWYNLNKCNPCTAGYYCADGRHRTECANGYISGAKSSSCTICPEGKYEVGNKSCEACPAGSYCTKGIKKNCSNQQYCPANSTAPIACPANATCDGKKFTCKTGYDKEGNQCVGHCAVGQWYNQNKCNVCTAGYYCADGRSRKECANGYVSASGKNVCTVCPEGQYEQNHTKCTACPVGSYCTKGIKKSCDKSKQYCPANSTAPIACPANATCDGKVFTCNKGYEQEGNQCVARCEKGEWYHQNKCNPCTAGYYCADGRNRKECTDGYISASGKDVCTVCPEGQYEQSHTKCTACPVGSYCTKGIKKSCDKSKQYCPANSTAPIACPANATCDGKAFTCKTGYHLSDDKKSCEVECTADGTYYNTTKKSCETCPAGSYCKAGKKTACPKGQYQDETGKAVCKACTGNQYTSSTGAQKVSTCTNNNQIVKADHTGCQNCAAGYKPNSGHTACELKCEVGQWWNTETSKCTTCSGNYYCPDRLTHKQCPKGQVPTADKTDCEVKCDPGFFLNVSKRCEECPAGSYCTDGKKVACPKGKYQNKTGQSECLACTGNKYTNATGRTSCSTCTTTNYAVDAGHTSCTACAKNKQANADHTACVDCTKALYNGSCGKCKANYPKKVAYACSKDKPICNANTGDCVACTTNYGSSTGIACDEELPVCQKGVCVAYTCPTGAVCSGATITGCKEGYLLSTDKKSCSACPANAKCAGGAATTLSSCIGTYKLSADKRSCEFECPTGTTCSGTTITGCKEGYLLSTDKKSCSACPANGKCAGGAATTLSSCIGTYKLSADKRSCEFECPTGAVCSGTTITGCKNDYYKKGDTCVPCASGYQETTSCLVGQDEYYANAPTCVKVRKIKCSGDKPICRAQNGQCYAEKEPAKTCATNQYAIAEACPNCVAPNGFEGTLDCGGCIPTCATCPANATCDGVNFTCNKGYVAQAGQCVVWLATTCLYGYQRTNDGKCELICAEDHYLVSAGGVTSPVSSLMLRRDIVSAGLGVVSCAACPVNATCDGVNFTCNKGYGKKDGQCVLNCTANYGANTSTACGEDKPLCDIQTGECKDCSQRPAVGDSCTNYTASCVYEGLICQNGKWAAPRECTTYLQSCAFEKDTTETVDGCAIIKHKETCSADKPVCNQTTGECEAAKRTVPDPVEFVTECKQGLYLNGDECQECPPGYYCPDGVEKVPCPKNTANPNFKAKSRKACIKCENPTEEGSPICAQAPTQKR